MTETRSMKQPPELAPPNPASCPAEGWTAAALAAELESTGFGGELVHRTVIGRSCEGRPIDLLEFGTGSTRVVAWSQMHGDEQTLTSACLNLLKLVVAAPDSPAIREVLEGCRVSLVPMLNPDGAERRTRATSLGIDLNRDARRVSTPEAEVLRRLILDKRPEFAFNLHNQNHRRWMPDGERGVSMSLLVPPATPEAADGPNLLNAERVAAGIVKSLDSACDGRVTRYAADYMPRAFGEWVQSQGVATVLLEAGGWPDGNVPALEQCALTALLAGLHSIATGRYESESTQAYRELPLARGRESFDLLVESAVLPTPSGAECRSVDLGINAPNLSAMPPCPGTGLIAEVGDLADYPRAEVLNAEGLVCLPGKVHVDQVDSVGEALSRERIDAAILSGATTLLVVLNDVDDETLNSIRQATDRSRPDCNVGFVLSESAAAKLSVADLEAAPRALLGVAPKTGSTPGELRIGEPADLVLCGHGVGDNAYQDLRFVLVGGTVVAAAGRVIARGAGRWLHRPLAVVPHLRFQPGQS